MWRFAHWDVLERSLSATVEVIKIISIELQDKDNYKRDYMFKQLWKSITSMWANIAEANVAISHKECRRILWISLREGNESLYRIQVVKRWIWITSFDRHVSEIQQICKIINTIIKNIN